MSYQSLHAKLSGRLPSPAVLIVTLSLAFGAFADGLPGEYFVTQRWRALNNPYSSLSNPANIAEENYLAVRAAVAPVLQGAFLLSEAGVNVPIGLYHTASLTMLMEGSGTVLTEIANPITGELDSSGNPLSDMKMMFSLGYAWHAWRHLIVGANVNVAYQANYGEPQIGVGIDLGVNYRLIRHPVLGEHIVGIATQNLVAPTIGDAEYSRNLRLSGYSKLWESRIENYLEFDLKDFFAKAEAFKRPSAQSVEDFAQSMEWVLNWRVGYWAMRMFKAYAIFGFDDNLLGYWGLALGAQVPSFNRGRDLSFYYQYNMMTEESSEASSHTFYVKADFGKHREEQLARKIARMASLNPNELYNRGRKLYSEGKYWDAFFIFSRLVTEFPDFFRNDWVSLFRADCQEQLDMRDQAIANYNMVKEKYPAAEVVAYADLGLMRIYYRNNNFQQATSQFVELNKPNVPDSLRHHGSYIMGQIYLQNGELRKAIHAFSVIPEDHPDYIHAQHGTAIAHAVLGSDMKEVIAALENVMSATPKTKEDQEIINRSYLFMGFIFYEEGALSKAVVALRQVPQTSYYYEDALLGQGWTALKARQWNDCINVGQTLVRTSPKAVLRTEGMLIQAYGYLLQKDYTRALEIVKNAHEQGQKLVAPHEDSLSVRSLQYDNSRLGYSQMSDRVEELSLIGQTSHLQGVIDSMKNRSDGYIKEFNDHAIYRHEFQRGTFFSRTIDQINDDLEYAHATLTKIVGAASATTVDKSQQKAAQQLDAEIEKLKREMEQESGSEGGEE